MTEEKAENANLSQMLEEQAIINIILEKGITIDVISYSLRRFFLKRENRFGQKVMAVRFTAPSLNTMDYAAEAKLMLSVNLEKMKENPVRFQNNMIKENALLMSRIIAVYYLNREWKIKFFGWFFARYFKKRLDAKMLSDAIAGLAILEDAGTFISSTVSASGTTRTTMPKPEKIEEKPTKA